MWARARTVAGLLLGLGFFVASCDSDSPGSPGTLEVYVYTNQGGESGKRIEIRGTSLSDTTDANGLAGFELSPGSHVVRAYGINQGGPCCPYVDKDTLIQAGKTVRVEFFDCLECD